MGGNEPVKLNFGKKFGNIELKQDGGIQRSAYRINPTADLIFNYYNNGIDGILDGTGLELFYKDLEAAAGKDKKLSAAEARKFLEKIGMKDVNKIDAREVLKIFVDIIGGRRDEIVSTDRDEGNNVTVIYKNGKVETYLYDEESQKSLLHEQKFRDNTGKHDVIYEADGKTKSSETIEKGSDITKIFYENGKVKKSNELRLYKKGDKSLKSIKVSEGTVYVLSEKDSNGKITKLTLLDDSKKEIAEFEADENGQLKQTVTEQNGVKTYTEGDKVITQFSETRIMTKIGDKVTLKDGDKEVILNYDKDGNLIAYPKEGETFKATAKRLGIDNKNEEQVKEFRKMNDKASKRSHGGWFKIGEEVKLPAGFEAILDIDKYEVDNKEEEANYIRRLAENPTTQVPSEQQLDYVKQAVNTVLRRGTLGNTVKSSVVSEKTYMLNGDYSKDYIAIQTDEKGMHSILIDIDETNSSFYDFSFEVNADGTLTKAYLIDSGGERTYVDINDESIRKMYDNIVNKFVKGKWPEIPEGLD